jgi:hypothetical protein
LLSGNGGEVVVVVAVVFLGETKKKIDQNKHTKSGQIQLSESSSAASH